MPNNNPQQSTSQQSTQRSEGSSKISDRVEKTADQASRLADKVGQTAEQTASAAMQRVRDARMQAQSGLEEQRAMVADRVRRLGGVLRAGSETLSTDDPFAQNLLTMAGERVENLAGYIEELTPGALAEDVQSFARRRPGLFFGGAFLIGLGLGRFVKSSARVASGVAHDLMDEDSYSESDYQQTAGQGSGYTQSGSSYTAGSEVQGTGASYGPTGSSGTTLPYGVGSGTTGTSGTGSSYGASSGTSGVGGSSSAFGTSGTSGTTGSTSNSTTTNTPRETERGQGSKS